MTEKTYRNKEEMLQALKKDKRNIKKDAEDLAKKVEKNQKP